MTGSLRVTQNTSNPTVDASIEVTLSKDLLEAFIQFEPPKNDGEPITLEKVMQEIANKKVVFGIDEQLLISLVEEPKYQTKIAFANGIPKKDGENGTISWHVKTNSSLQPKENPDGSVNFRDLGIAENITKGQILCTINQPIVGEEGMTVTGLRIAPAIGKPVPSPLGKNVVYSEDETQVLADMDGQLNIVSNKVSIEQTLVIDGDIDNSTGNINFLGNVVIKGGVNSGFTVEARGTIDIAGFVEAATIKAGGDIVLRSGMNGASKGTIECAGNLTCTFIQNSDIFVNGNLYTQYLVQCQIKVGGNIDLVGKISSLVGGNCFTGGSISAKTIGNQFGLKTTVVLGVSHSLIVRQMELNNEIPDLTTKIDNLYKIINLLSPLHEANRLPAERVSMLENATLSFTTCSKMLEECKLELLDIEEKVNVHTFGKISCKGTIHPGTMVTIGSAKYMVERPLNFSSLYYSSGEIAIGSA
ncbi:MAG: hypothetical protein K0R71_2179 [Bacillales bacterium]|jgi:uncharacterized protein (DUF342 family)|nr:hypothetical protein [Bacillales bacterium]